MEQLAPVMLLVSGILLVLLGVGRSWKPFAWLTPGGLIARVALVVGIVDIVVAIMLLT